MERNQLILLIIGIFIAVLVGGTMAIILLYGEKQRKRLAEIGDIDDELKREFIADHTHKGRKIALKTIELVIAAGLLTIVALAIVAKNNGEQLNIGGQSVYVVRSSSMSKLNPQNPYYKLISENKWNSRFDVYDIVFVKAKPEEKDLQLGQTIVYRRNGQNIIHRLVEIRAPSTLTKDQKSYICVGDANTFADAYILYDDIIGVYTSNKVPFVGVFILWLQSSLGYVVVGIIIIYGIFSTCLESTLVKARDKRLLDIGYIIAIDDSKLIKKYHLNPNSSELSVNREIKKNAKEPVVRLSRHDIISTKPIDAYNFKGKTNCSYICTNYRYKVIRCLNDRYVCVKVTFDCKGNNITKYLFINKQEKVDYIKLANRCMRYLTHSGRLNSHIAKQLKLFGNKQK